MSRSAKSQVALLSLWFLLVSFPVYSALDVFSQGADIDVMARSGSSPLNLIIESGLSGKVSVSHRGTLSTPIAEDTQSAVPVIIERRQPAPVELKFSPNYQLIGEAAVYGPESAEAHFCAWPSGSHSLTDSQNGHSYRVKFAAPVPDWFGSLPGSMNTTECVRDAPQPEVIDFRKLSSGDYARQTAHPGLSEDGYSSHSLPAHGEFMPGLFILVQTVNGQHYLVIVTLDEQGGHSVRYYYIGRDDATEWMDHFQWREFGRQPEMDEWGITSGFGGVTVRHRTLPEELYSSLQRESRTNLDSDDMVLIWRRERLTAYLRNGGVRIIELPVNTEDGPWWTMGLTWKKAPPPAVSEEQQMVDIEDRYGSQARYTEVHELAHDFYRTLCEILGIWDQKTRSERVKEFYHLLGGAVAELLKNQKTVVKLERNIRIPANPYSPFLVYVSHVCKDFLLLYRDSKKNITQASFMELFFAILKVAPVPESVFGVCRKYLNMHETRQQILQKQEDERRRDQEAVQQYLVEQAEKKDTQ